MNLKDVGKGMISSCDWLLAGIFVLLFVIAFGLAILVWQSWPWWDK